MSRDTFDLFHQRDRGRFGDDETRPDSTSSAPTSQVEEMRAFDLVLHAETFPKVDDKGAVLVSGAGQEISAVWIPKALLTLERSNRAVEGVKKNGQKVQLTAITVHAPEWVAKEKGLI